MIKKISKKMLVILAIFSILAVYLPGLSLISFAENNITSLETPTNLKWIEGSSATATWDAVENANYYYLNLYIYRDGNLIGSQETGTANNEIDLQQEIYNILDGNTTEGFEIEFDVTAAYISDNGDILSSISDKSPLFISKDKIGCIQLDVPTNVNIDNDYNASWTAVSNADYYCLYFSINGINMTWVESIRPAEGSTKNGIFNINIEELIKEKYIEYREAGYSDETVTVKIKLKAIMSALSTSDYIDSDVSEYSNVVEYSNENIKKLNTPTNVNIDNNYNASWTVVPNADYYCLYFAINGINMTWVELIRPAEGSTQNGIFNINIKELIKEKYIEYREAGYSDETVTVKIKLKAIISHNSTSDYINSEISEYSNIVNYSNNNITKLETPTNVNIDNDYNASWTAVPKADYYCLYFSINGINMTWIELIRPAEGSTQNGIFNINIEELIKEKYIEYRKAGYSDETVTVKIKLKAIMSESSASDYMDSDVSSYSNIVYYNPNGSTKINNIMLSPQRPVIAVGRTLYIGKTIEPNDAIYETINWFTSDKSIVSISNMGQITGIKKGNATITAQINNATQTAEVSVYEIESNISNENEANEVINEANNVIEAVITNGDINNTDIMDRDDAINEIEQGAQNGNIFNVNIEYNNKTLDEYDNIKDMINSQYDGYNIAGGNDIRIAISHTDEEGTAHHIANITELENEVNIQFDIPTNIPKQSKTQKREYKLVRYHNQSIEDINFEINDGKIESNSDKFSDFVLLYKDTNLPTFNISGTITSYNSEIDDITLQLYEEGITEIFAEEKVKGNNTNYSIENIPSGNYTLKCVKNNHVTREYSITVDNGNVSQNIQICLSGDINGDGKVNIKDWNKLYNHINETVQLTDYQLVCADTNEDDKVNIKDWNRLYNHINELNPLW